MLLFQYVPNASIWFGIMSLPLISYLIYFFQQPSILWLDLDFFLSHSFESYITLFGAVLFIYSLIILLKNRKSLVIKGPYKYIRHPQYLGIIVMTFGLTALSLDAYPIHPIYPNEYFNKSWILYIWIVEVLIYTILAKIEDLSLRLKFGDEFIKYANKVPFMFPFLNFYRIKKNN